jgi:hypothetical protein
MTKRPRSPAGHLGVSVDRRAALVSQAVTYGPMFSPEINKLIGDARDLKAIARSPPHLSAGNCHDHG